MNGKGGRRIYVEEAMPTPGISRANELALPTAATARSAETRPEIEAEVIRLFDRFRNSLFRYVLSFGIPVQDSEEVIQEAFLALFHHLCLGKPRENLPAGYFAWRTTWR